MAILNKDNFPYILSWDEPNNICNINIEYKKDGYPVFPCYNFEDKDYWFIGFLNGDAFYHYSIKTIIPHEILIKIRSGDITLVLCNNHEPYHSIIEGIYKFVIMGADIHPNNIMVLSSSYDLQKEVKCVSNKYNLGEIKAVYVREFELDAKTYVKNSDISTFPKTLEFKHYEKKFLSFNGLNRPHRSSLIAFMSAFNILHKGNVSYNSMPNQNLSTDNIYRDLVERHKNHIEASSLVYAQKEFILNLEKLSLDTDDNTHKDMAQYSKLINQLYENTYFSIVTETMCFQRSGGHGYSGTGRLLSEKTFKPIIFKHPFILVAVPGCIKQLKELGYKTFSPYIDESYDDEIDDSTRILKIVKEIEKLCNLTDDKLKEFLEFSKEVTEHNFNHLMNLCNFHKVLN